MRAGLRNRKFNYHGLSRVNRKREIYIEGNEFHKRGIRQVYKLRSTDEENGIRFNLDDLAEQVLDEQKENGSMFGRLWVRFLRHGIINKISFSSRVNIWESMESETVFLCSQERSYCLG